MRQLEIQGVIHTDAHIFAYAYLYQSKSEIVRIRRFVEL